MGLGHDFHKHTTGWKWKVTSSFGETGLPEIRQKTVLPIFPGFDVSVGWNAQYELPDLRGYVPLPIPFLPRRRKNSTYGSLRLLSGGEAVTLKLRQATFNGNFRVILSII